MYRFILILTLGLISCNDVKEPNQKREVSSKQASNKESAQGLKELPELSIYHLPSTWTTQNNDQVQLADLRGQVLVMVMIYSSCKAACPRLVADMRNIEAQINKGDLEKVKFILVSIDPETDTPQRLKDFSIENEMMDNHWLFLRGTSDDTREFANVLAVSYKKISPIDFTHSNIISVFNEEGVLVHQQEGLGVDNTETVEAIKLELNQ